MATCNVRCPGYKWDGKTEPDSNKTNTGEIDIEKIVGFFDGRCPKCGKRIGWIGRLEDRPACQQCGDTGDNTPTQEQQRIAQINARILSRFPGNALSETERIFAKNMADKTDGYTAKQVANINRIYKSVTR